MALAYVNSRAFLTSTIIGATSLDQPRTDSASIDVRLSDEVIAGIEDMHRDIPDLCP